MTGLSKEAFVQDEVIAFEIKDEFRICPECGYKDGFHSVFEKTGNKTRWLFVCPACHRIFDVGLTV